MSMTQSLRDLRVELSDSDLSSFAQKYGFDEHFLQAILNVESKGEAADSQGRMLLLPEKHVFWRELPKPLRKKARSLGLATPKWSRSNYKGLGDNGSDLRWDRLEDMADVNEEAALKSCSYAKPQIMGFNYELCGFDSVRDFVISLGSSEEAQDLAFFAFLLARGLGDEIRRYDVEAVVRVYNGPGQVKRYSEEVRSEYRHLTGRDLFEIRASRTLRMLRLGSCGYQVKALQERLSELGYTCKPDGDFGPGTRKAVLAFQADNGLAVDGKVGDATHEALERANPAVSILKEARADLTVKDLRAGGSQTVKQADRLTVLGGGALAVGGLSEAGDLLSDLPFTQNLSLIQDLMMQVQGLIEPFSALFVSNKWLALAAAGGAVAYLGWKIKQRRLEDARSWRHVG